ncbi:tetratricopeptide repeat protein [Ekhidna sp.]
MKLGKTIWKNLAIYLGSAWVIMEALNFFIERYHLEPMLLDIVIILLFFGILTTVIYSSFSGRWNRVAIAAQILNSVFALLVVGYFLMNPLNLNPRSLHFASININKSSLSEFSSVAVLPVQNNLPNNENDYLLAGFHDGIITELGKLGTLKTISRTTMAHYANSSKDLRSIAKELDVNTVLESSLSPSQGQFVLRVRLLDAFSEDLLWSDEFKTTVSEMPGLFETVSQIIATKLDPNTIENVRVHEEVNHEAYIEIVKGNILLQKFTSSALWEALNHFQKTIHLDSMNIEGYLGVAKAWIYLQQLSVVNPQRARPYIYEYYLLAKELEPDHWQIHYIDAAIKFFIEFNFDEGIKSALRSIEQNPNNSDSRSLLAHCYMITGDWQKAWEQMRYAKEIDPLNPQVIGFEFLMFGQQGKFLSAIKSMELLAAIDPDNLFYRTFSTVKNRDLGNDKEAIKWLKLQYSDISDDLAIERFVEETYKETSSVGETWYRVVTEFCPSNCEAYLPALITRTLYSFYPGHNDDLLFENLVIMIQDGHPDLPYFNIKDGSPIQNDPRYIKAMQDLGFW